MTLAQRLSLAFQNVGNDVKTLFTRVGALENAAASGGSNGEAYNISKLATDVAALGVATPEDSDFAIALRNGQSPQILRVPSVIAEVLAARGNRMSLNERISIISGLAGNNLAPPVVGRHYDNAFTPAPLTGTIGLATNRFSSVPYVSPHRWRIDRLGFNVVAPVTGLFRCFIYAANPTTLMPTNQLFVGALELDTSTAGSKEHILDFVFEADTLYWIGHNGNVSATGGTIRGFATGSGKGFGPGSATDTSYRTGFTKTNIISTNPLPNLAPVVESDLQVIGNQLPLFRMRAAAL